jgi:hypothetical protein
MPLNAWTIEPSSGSHSAMLGDPLEEVPGVATLRVLLKVVAGSASLGEYG